MKVAEVLCCLPEGCPLHTGDHPHDKKGGENPWARLAACEDVTTTEAEAMHSGTAEAMNPEHHPVTDTVFYLMTEACSVIILKIRWFNSLELFSVNVTRVSWFAPSPSPSIFS